MTLFGSADKKPAPVKSASLDTGLDQKSVPPVKKRDLSWLVPPQEEMVDVARARGGKARIDTAVERWEAQINKHQIEYTPPRTLTEIAEERALRGAVFSGMSGVTGEDIGFAERHHLVRRNT